ncbi:MAG: immunoglobulin-like domain-containing protein, partial [Opitutae bacterium]
MALSSWHLHAGDANNNDQANFWIDGIQLVVNGSGLSDTRYKPRNINLGGYNDNNELSKCEIAEVILYNRILSPIEYTVLTAHLNSKYGLNGGGSFVMETVDTSSTGERSVGYMSIDSSGNISTATRKVVVVEPATLPVITLNGEASLNHDSGTPYEDAGATVADSAGNTLDASHLVVSSNVNVNVPGSYAVAYDYTATDGTKAPTMVRVVTVLDKTAPVITLVGGETYEHTLGNLWVEPGVSALDNADGQVEVENSLLKKNFFLRRGYLIDPSVDSLIDLSNGGGLLSQEAINEVAYIYGPRGEGIYLDGDNDHMDHNPPAPYDVGIDRVDQYQNLFLGYFHCKLDGARYEFGVEWPDDRASVWLDLDQDGIFELEGDRGTELMNGPTFQRGFLEVTLDKGFYKYAVAHREGGGGSRVDARFRAIIGPGPTTLVRPNPGDPKQDGLWVQYQPIDVFTEGEYEITYSAKDSAGNISEIKRKVIVKTNPDAPIIYLKGEESITLNYGDAFEDPGTFVEDLDGNAVEGDLLVSGQVDTQRMGIYRLRYDFTSNAGLVARTVVREVNVVDAEAPVITLVGDINATVIQGHEYTDPGARAVDNYDGELPVVQSGYSQSGLMLHLDASNIRDVRSGDTVEIWNDLSGNGNDATRNTGSPYLDADAINGMPAVYFNGNSQIDAPPYIGSSYSVVAVVQADGIRNGRLLATDNESKNWFMGYHGGYEDVFHPGTWRTNRTIQVSKKPRLYTATSTGNNEVHFYADGVELTTATNANLDIGRFHMGAWASLRERSSGHVAEVFIYNRPLNHSERLSLEAQMNAKYSLNGFEKSRVPVNTGILGTYEVVYSATDSSGNLAVVRRVVQVVPDPDAPVISLIGEPKIVHEAGNPFEDPGVSLTAGEQVLDASLVKVDGSVDVKTPGDYTLTYNYRPYKETHAIDVIRIVSVVDTQPPVITLVGESVIRLAVGSSYEEPGFDAMDASDGETIAYSHLDKTPNLLDVNGYMIDGRDNQQMNFNQGGGLFSAQPVGVGTFAGDITGINGDGAFRAIIPEISRNDDYQFLFHGEFYAKEDGSYEFGID